MNRVDFSDCEKSNVEYSGASEKIGVIYNESRLMLKFNNKTPLGEDSSDISEYLGSKIFKMLNINTHEVILGTYKGRNVVAAIDFCYPNKQFKPFSDVGESSIETQERISYSFNEIQSLIYKTKRIKDIDKKKMVESFWDVYIVDCLIANSDRHPKNWGFLKNDDFYCLAPIFDNGKSLFPRIIDEEELNFIINDEEEMLERVYDRPKSIIKDEEGTSDYYSIISSKKYKECNEAVKRIVPKINLNRIEELIDSISNSDCSSIKKEFLKRIIKLRFDLILKATYRSLQNE